MLYEIDGRAIANNIRAERSRVKLTIEEVSKQLGVSKTTYIEYEKNAEKIQTKYLIALANIFRCDINCFFTQQSLTKC